MGKRATFVAWLVGSKIAAAAVVLSVRAGRAEKGNEDERATLAICWQSVGNQSGPEVPEKKIRRVQSTPLQKKTCGPVHSMRFDHQQKKSRRSPVHSRRSKNHQRSSPVQSGPLVRWSAGPLVRWSAGPLVRWSAGRNKKQGSGRTISTGEKKCAGSGPIFCRWGAWGYGELGPGTDGRAIRAGSQKLAAVTDGVKKRDEESTR
ncbi:hypothetical protein C5Y97_06760 [Blastopirellula marina]|uniref:Secreted protein n=1 Tax=Blastopirellula marina TaxID=124 RepID=A0A2S8G793_9BACT|nr:hypothetical protein C5Y98_06760 [Blastopirellula marina]PTL45389.1 hypothetical protein C5Y97_06760 [Blastopirellula marina]